jgi:biopolymer transport protein ExbD
VSNPKSASDTKAKQTVVVTIDKDQNLFIGSAPVLIDSLSSQLKTFLDKETEKPSVVINGDSVAKLGVTIKVMQIIKQLGATPVVAVDPSH